MEHAKYLILFLTMAAVVGLSGCMDGEKESVLENFTNESVAVNASPDVAVNASPDVAVNATPDVAVNAPSPPKADVTAQNMYNIGGMVQVTRIGEANSRDPSIEFFRSDIVFEIKNIWGKKIERIDVTVLEKQCVGEPIIDFGRKFFLFKNLTSGGKEEITVTFLKFEGYESGQKFTCPMDISIWTEAKRAGDVIYFDIIVP